MANRDYREVASEIVERYITAQENNKKLFKDDNYDRGYSHAVQMVLSVLSEREITEVKNFYKFSKVFEENC